MSEILKIGIAGAGIVGGSLMRWLRKNTCHEVLVYDPRLGFTDDLSQARVLFVAVPVPTFEQRQNLDIVDTVLRHHGRSHQTIFIRSTVLPGTCDKLSDLHNLNVYSMPEFLTERISDEDIKTQGIVAGHSAGLRAEQYSLLSQVFVKSKPILLMSNTEAELAKYMHNGNGTVKVAFNNMIYQLCLKHDADYDRVRMGALMSGYVSPNHTLVPGPDSRLGYGGTCFPKDMDALIGDLKRNGVPCESLVEMQKENLRLRDLIPIEGEHVV